jgi:plastocyanin
MRRAMLVCLIVGAGVVVGVPGTAMAGAGCHTGATQADETGEKEATVRMIDRCFTASVTKVDPGSPVTFVHEDPKTIHNVGGTEWGYFGDMTKGDVFTATFDDPGIYPFACSYHPGMTGAIVVGDGTGAGTGWTVSNEPFEAPTRIVTRTADGSGGVPAGAAIGVGRAGLLLGGLVTFAIAKAGGRSRPTA